LPWWYRHAPDIERQLAWRHRVIARLGLDWMELPFCTPRAEREVLAVEERADGVFVVNRQTGHARRLEREAVGGWSEPYARSAQAVPALPESREQIEAEIPLPGQFEPAEILTSGRADLAQALLRETANSIFPIVHVSAPLWDCYNRWGFEGMMVMVAKRPDLVEYACDRRLGGLLRDVQAAAALGAGGIWIEDCMTDMVSPAAFARLNVPFLRRLTEGIRALGMRSIHYFCGNPGGKWDLLLATGADALALEEGKKGFEINIEEVVERVGGRCTVLGNLDAIHLLEQGSEDELRGEIARQIRAGRRNGSRFIMSIGSPVTPGTPPARVRLYGDLAHELGSRG
jgi:hypothetical protein